MNLGGSLVQFFGEAGKAFDAFELACREGRRPRIEDVLEYAPPKVTLAAPAGDNVADVPKLDRDTWRYLRGGAFEFSPFKARSADRDEADVEANRDFIGFRVVRTLRTESK